MLYPKLLSFIDEPKRSVLQNNHSQDKVYAADKELVEFCIDLAKVWILQTLPYFPKSLLQKINPDTKERIVNDLLTLQKDCKQEGKRRIDSKIYAYYLFFSGILLLIRDQHDFLLHLKAFFLDEMERQTDSSIRHFFGFITVYIDIININIKDIDVFEDLKNYLKDDKFFKNIIFDAIQKERKLMSEIMKETPERQELRKALLFEMFPKLEQKYIHNETKDIIESIIQSGLARLYFVGGYYDQHQEKIEESLENFPYNSFALVQKGYLLVNPKLINENEDRPRDLDNAKKCFMRTIRLIDEDNQFDNNKAFKYRIKLESILGLAYIDYLRGLGDDADKKYRDAEGIINDHLSENKNNKDYLLAILKVNRGRNLLENKVHKHNINVVKVFEQVFNIYDNAESEIKEELENTVARAHTNLGIYYLMEGLYEDAEEQFKQAIRINNTNPHAKYNLGVLYYKKGEYDRALTLIRNAGYLDSKFAETKKTLGKISSEKRRGVGTEWFDWWWNIDKKMVEKSKLRKLKSHISLKRLVLIMLISTMILTLGTFIFGLYMHEILNVFPANNSTSPLNNTTVNKYGLMIDSTNIKLHISEIDENAFLIIIAICIVLILLPFINKLKLGAVDIELESAGSRPIGPTSITGGISDQDDTADVKYQFFFPRYWY